MTGRRVALIVALLVAGTLSLYAEGRFQPEPGIGFGFGAILFLIAGGLTYRG